MRARAPRAGLPANVLQGFIGRQSKHRREPLDLGIATADRRRAVQKVTNCGGVKVGAPGECVLPLACHASFKDAPPKFVTDSQQVAGNRLTTNWGTD